VWHYKCIRPILNGATWPNFLCPNCRAVADLEADVEDPGEFEEWDDDVEQTNGESEENGKSQQEDRHLTPRASAAPILEAPEAQTNGHVDLTDLEAAISNISIADSLNGIANLPMPDPATPQRFVSPAPSSSVTQPVAINIVNNNENPGLSPLFPTGTDGLSPERVADGPMTPRNDAGPFVLDGSAGRGSSRSREEESPNPGSSGAAVLPPVRTD
jgi:E3 ubiquitin-protein ligase DMA1/2